jgi:hypothetical protein
VVPAQVLLVLPVLLVDLVAAGLVVLVLRVPREPARVVRARAQVVQELAVLVVPAELPLAAAVVDLAVSVAVVLQLPLSRPSS